MAGGHHGRFDLSDRLDRDHHVHSLGLWPSLRTHTMSIETVERETLAAERPADDQWTLQWSPIVAGALTACAVSFIMITFATTVGLGVSSAAPTWRDASVALWGLSGIYLVLQALISFGCGGYLAGRCRLPYDAGIGDETEKRDGLHGVASWALAVVLGIILT